MFWKFNLLTTAHIDTLLAKENVTLKELMDEEDILQECKAQNKSLIDFLVRADVLEEMVNLVSHEPSEELEESQRYKYSNIASELLTADVDQINECLVSDETLLNRLYAFLETEGPLNPLLASFFSKTFTLLMIRKTQQMFDYIKKKEDFLVLILNHLGTSAIMDVVVKLVSCTDNNKLKTEILNFLNEKQLVQRLTSFIHCSKDENQQGNAAQALCEILYAGRESIAQVQDKPEPDPLLRTLEATETIAELLGYMLGDTLTESVLVSGISVLLALLENKKPGPNMQEQGNEQSLYFHLESQESIQTDPEIHMQGVRNVVAALCPRLKDFHELLLHPPPKNQIVTSMGVLDPPLGATRLNIARLVAAVLANNMHSVNVELQRLGTIEVLVDLFYKFSWNNFLHTQVERTLVHILSNGPTEDGNTPAHPLLVQLISQCGIVQRIVESWDESEQTPKPTCRRGYMGHLTKIANQLAQGAENGVNKFLIQELIKGLPDDSQQKWNTFVSETLVEINKKNDTPLVVCGQPVPSSSEEGDQGFRDIMYPTDPNIQQAFSEYQMQQMTSTFIDQFGFHDDEFGDNEESLNAPLERLSSPNFNISTDDQTKRSELFEQICNERIQTLDDGGDSDEDIWEDKEHELTFQPSPGASDLTPDSKQRTSLNAPPERGSSEEHSSSDSDEDVGAARTKIPEISKSEESVRMDVDQCEIAEEVPIAMDTGNPWDVPATTTVQPPASASDDAGWANFGAASAAFDTNFADFSAANFDSATETVFSPTTPMVVETNEESAGAKGSAGGSTDTTRICPNESGIKLVELSQQLGPPATAEGDVSDKAPTKENGPVPPNCDKSITSKQEPSSAKEDEVSGNSVINGPT